MIFERHIVGHRQMARITGFSKTYMNDVERISSLPREVFDRGRYVSVILITLLNDQGGFQLFLSSEFGQDGYLFRLSDCLFEERVSLHSSSLPIKRF